MAEGALVERVRELPRWVREDAEQWCDEREGWWLRATLLVYLVYAGVRTLVDGKYHTGFSGLTFGLHETGHLLFSWCGQWIGIAGGTGLQIAAPILAGIHLIWTQHDYFGLAVCTCWLGFSMQDAAIYIGDARAQALPLMSFSDDPIHDWHYLLNSVGWLNWDTAIARAVREAGTGLWGLACLASVWLCWRIAHKGR